MTKYRMGRDGGDRATLDKHCGIDFSPVPSFVKRVIVAGGMRGFIPREWATFLIQLGGLKDA